MLTPGGRRKSIAFFIVLGVCLTAGAVTLNISWVIVNWRQAGMLILGLLAFPFIITGVVLNTIFLVREIRRNEQHDAFINAVTHELKTPVASIRLYLQTLQAREIDEAKRREFYRIMVEDTDRLMGTIDQVLRAGFAGAKARRANAPVNLPQMVRECLELARTRHHLADAAIGYSETLSDGSTLSVSGDEDELRAAVSNLLDNAIKYSTGDVNVAVELDQPTPKTLRLRVRDNGVGISSEELKRIFKRFYRIPGTTGARVKGTGLGLFIVRSVVARHGGKVFASSEGPGHGSTFTVELPALPAQ